MKKLIIIPAVLAYLTGCASLAFQGQGTAVGGIYTDAMTPFAVTQNEVGKKKGEACATSILGIITTGDASIRSAADAGGITTISAVDSSFMHILGIYSKYCVVVSGKG
jgi:hypothetical protein